MSDETKPQEGDGAQGTPPPADTGGPDKAPDTAEGKDAGRDQGEAKDGAQAATPVERTPLSSYLLEDLAADFPWNVPEVNLRGLGAEEVAVDEELAKACFEDEEGRLVCEPLLNWKVGAGIACLAAARAAEEIFAVLDEDTSLAEHLTQERIADIVTMQGRQHHALPAETCFRAVVPQAGAIWPDCPKWLSAWFSVFCATALALDPIIIAERAELEKRVDVIKRTEGAKLMEQKRAAKVKARESKAKARRRKMKRQKPILKSPA